MHILTSVLNIKNTADETYLGVGVDVKGHAKGVKSRDLTMNVNAVSIARTERNKSDIRDVVVLALTLLLLELEGDTTDWSTLNALHQVSGESSDLVAKSLGGDDGNFIADLLVGVEVCAMNSVSFSTFRVRRESPIRTRRTKSESGVVTMDTSVLVL